MDLSVANRRIELYLATGNQAKIRSVLGDAHVFWFDDCPPEETDFVLINRNGNTNRAAKVNGQWHLIRGFGTAARGPFSVEFAEQLQVREHLVDLIQLCWLPERDREQLTFMPKALSPPQGRRQIIVRDRLFDYLGRGDDGFILRATPDLQSPMFEGKPWECPQAMDWALNFISGSDAPAAPASREKLLDNMRAEDVAAKMEDAIELYGSW